MKVVIHNKSSKPYKIRYKAKAKGIPAFIPALSRLTLNADDLELNYLEIGKNQGIIDYSLVKEPEKTSRKKVR